MLKQYTKIFNESLNGVDVSHIPNKYLNPRKNYDRIMRVISRAKKLKLSKGLDFGCGSIGSCIVGRLHGIDVSGLDIPYGTDDSKEGERNRKGVKTSQVENKKSVHLGPQENLIKMGYDIFIRDTTRYPWVDFKDNEFDFVMAYFSLSKEWIAHSDTLDFNGSVYNQRLNELFRITKNNGVWFVLPIEHIRSVNKYGTKKNVVIKKW